MVRGLIVGKFYPPHAGHHHLIRTARAQVDELVVAVCELPGQEPPARRRSSWLAESHPDCDVRVIHDIGHDDDSAVWADYTRSFLPGRPDLVFTSEDYGETYARELGCRHVCVDRDRSTVPISGTRLRARPADHWGFLEAPARAGLTKRIALVGAASTGTTTLTRALAQRYRTTWVAEYGREYSARHHPHDEPWTTDEFRVIARRQQEQEDALARHAGPVLFCDTDALATTLWHEHYVGGRCPDVEAIAESRRYAAYVLTGDEIPFEDDGTRDRPDRRPVMQEQFRDRLRARPEPWIEVRGSVEERLAAVHRFLIEVIGPEWLPPRPR